MEKMTPAHPENTTQSKDRDSEIAVILGEFCEETTAHGPAHITHAKVKWKKICWASLSCVALVGLIFHVVLTIMLYFSFPVAEMTYISHNSPTFPHVTFCNLNPISNKGFSQMLQTSNSATSKFKDIIYRLKPFFTSRDIGWLSGEEHLDDLLASARSYFENIGIHEAEMIGHTLNNFILDCSFAGIPCTEQDFEHFLHPLFFNCYTFTGNHVRAALNGSGNGDGPSDGLSLILYLETDPNIRNNGYYNRFSPVSNGLGARLDVHSKGIYPTLRGHGVDITPGHTTSIGIKIDKLIKLSHPYGNCTYRTVSDPDHERYDYSSYLCFGLCGQKYIQDQCNCSRATLPFYGENKPTCGSFYTSNGSDALLRGLKDYMGRIHCQDSAWKRFLKDKNTLCNCPSACHRVLFPPVTSQSAWPAPKFYTDFFKEIVAGRDDKDTLIAYQTLKAEFMQNTPDKAKLKELIDENFARVNVYFAELDTFITEEVPSLTYQQLLADIGGTLGLWAGFSIITCMEVAGLFVQLCTAKCKRP